MTLDKKLFEKVKDREDIQLVRGIVELSNETDAQSLVTYVQFQDFRIKVGTYSFWRTVVRRARDNLNLTEQQTFSPTDGL